MEWQQIYDEIKQDFQGSTGIEPADDGELGIRMKLVAGEIAQLYGKLDFLTQQAFPQTATGVYLDRHGQTRDLVRKQAGAAAGKLEFKKATEAAQDIPIPSGTVCTSSAGGNIMYQTTEDGVLTQGSTTVLIPAQAVQTGKNTNLPSDSIDRMVTPVAGIDSVNNPEPFTGGMEEEDDVSFRKRLMDSYVNVSNGANLKFYENTALENSRVWSAKAVFATDPSNLLNLYISDFFRTTPADLCTEVSNTIKAVREMNLQVKVSAAEVITQDITMVIYVDSLQNQGQKYGQASNYMSDYLYSLKVGESFNPYNVAAAISNRIDGFSEVVFTSPTTLVEIEPNQIIKPGKITISLERK